MRPRRLWAMPLVPLYAGGLALKQAFAPKPRALTWPVISVGSLSAGGAGKTPAVIALAELLAANGWSPTVLSRGYGRAVIARNTPVEVMPAYLDAADRFGDEPTLIARRTGLPVWVCADRLRAGEAAERVALEHSFNPTTEEATVEAAHPPLHILDDGFQHRRLARALDVVLATAADLDDMLLPAGNLREPLSALRRAHVIVLRDEEAVALSPRLRPLLSTGTHIWHIRRTLRLPQPVGIFSAGLRPMAFCGLARPEDFTASLAAAGVGLVGTLAFPDHHRYTHADLDHLLAVSRTLAPSGFITTEKDAVKLTPALRERLESFGPLVVAALDAAFTDPASLLKTMQERLA
jgi:tetraacyldisaccharide 4'-kinase